MTPLETYIAVKTEMRESDLRILKRYGLKWKGLSALEAEILDQIPEEGLEANGLQFIVESKPVFYGKGERKQIDTVKRITIHSIK